MSIHVHTADVDIDDVTKMFEELILHSFFCRGGGVLCLLINKLLLLPGWLVTGRCHLAIVSKLIEQFVLGRGLGLGPGLGAETRPSPGLYAQLSTPHCTFTRRHQLWTSKYILLSAFPSICMAELDKNALLCV